MPDTIIEINNLIKEYDGNRAVDGLNLQINQGEIFGLLGPNGSGKTTTILMMLGLTEPTDGSVYIKGFNSTSEPIEVKKITGYLPDQVGFYENMTGLENLIYTARLNGLEKNDASKLAKRFLDTVGLSKVINDKVGTYSRGMRQRLGLADVLIKEPEIIILDEPTIGIDPKGIDEFLQLIKNLSKEKGITVILSSHLLHQVQKICDRVGLFIDGKLLAVGNIDELADKLFEDQDTVIEVKTDITNDILSELKNLEGVNEVSYDKNQLTIKSNCNLASDIAHLIIDNGGSLSYLSSKEYGLDEIYQYYFKGGVANG